MPSGLNKKRIKAIISSRRRKLSRWIRLNRVIRGLPPGLDFRTIDQICVDHFGGPLKGSSYVHLSGWKVSGAYRLKLSTASGQRWCLIYKYANYQESELPALKGLPLKPGRPEFLLYHKTFETLERYLPNVYLCREHIPNLQYSYLIEDLEPTFDRVGKFIETQSDSIEKLQNLISIIPIIHNALNEWGEEIGHASILHYDTDFTSKLIPYAEKNLKSYIDETGDHGISKVFGILPRLGVINRDDISRFNSESIVHGDFQIQHMFINKKDKKDIKIIDWEWVGKGKVQRDLVTLLKNADAAMEKFGITTYAGLNTNLSFSEHERLYQWTKIERAIFDTAFLARQYLLSSRRPVWIPIYIRRAVRLAVNAHELMLN
jgi:hypothetical protein